MTIRKLLHSSLAGIALSAAAAVLASPAAPAATPAIGTLTVHYSDVDLSTTQGAPPEAELAANLVCGESDNSLAQQRSWNDCYRRAVADAVGTVDNPRLTAVYRAHSGAAAVTAMLTR